MISDQCVYDEDIFQALPQISPRAHYSPGNNELSMNLMWIGYNYRCNPETFSEYPGIYFELRQPSHPSKADGRVSEARNKCLEVLQVDPDNEKAKTCARPAPYETSTPTRNR